VFRYLATSTGNFSKATMSAAFAGGVLEIIRLVEAKVSFASVTAVEVAEWAAEGVHAWNFEVVEWLLRERPDVFAHAAASRILWLAAAKARDLATLRTLSLPEFRFDDFGAEFLALICSPKGTQLSDARGIVARALVSDHVEALALLSWALSWAPVERGRVAHVMEELALASRNVHVIDALLELTAGPTSPFETLPPVMSAVFAHEHDLTFALLCRGYDFERFAERGQSVLGLACHEGEAWLDVVEFLCKNLSPGAADLPPGRRLKGAVHWACESKSLSVVKAVLDRPEVDVNRVDQWGHSGPYYAIDKMSEADFAELMRMLIDRGLDLNGDALTIIPELIWAKRPMYSVIEFLFENGLDPLAELPGWGGWVWQFFDGPDPQLRLMYHKYCARAVDTT
jgi:hypothetical protein